MKKCILWDLISPINGISSNEILEKDYIKKILNREDEIVLYGDDVITEQILSGSSIRYECRLSQDTPIGVAMQKFCELKQQQEIETLSLEEATKKISILEVENADLLLDSAIKDSKIQTLENDLADLTLEIAMMEVR